MIDYMKRYAKGSILSRVNIYEKYIDSWYIYNDSWSVK